MSRKTCLSVSLLACMALICTTSALKAQAGFGRPTAGIFGGVSFPRADFAEEAGTGWHGGALVKVRAYGPLDVRLDGTYVKFGTYDIVRTDGTLRTDATVGFGTLNGLVNLGTDSAAYPGDNSVSPYLIAGFGKYQLKYDAECTLGICGADPGARTHWGLNVGGGATVPIVGIRAFVEARYHRISRDIAVGGSRTMVLVSAGVKFR